MLTQNEISTLTLSPTKKDFVQIWNELLEVAGKLSERWDPTSTNESDPGIVILKALTGIADKLNYNIDKNTLEAFMPTAAQEDSMRKLCEMLGYNIKYYQSATTTITVKYHNSDPDNIEEKEALENGKLLIPKFTVISNSDQDVNYFIIDDPVYNAPSYISVDTPTKTFVCMEGQVIKCESINDNDIITINQISNNRYYLPEVYIAENGIFIYNVLDSTAVGGSALEDGTPWTKVDNLNTQEAGSRVFKFGFDSYEGRPYVEFPEDYSELFDNGIFIYYTRTNGAAGNISARTLTKIELPTTGDWSAISANSFSVENTFSATTGRDIETINQAYNNFKKTIGTFDTLVTCRDYMNKIYTMTENDKPIVSNVLVTDIRNDLNRAVTICSCDDSGIFYKETSLIKDKNNITRTDVVNTTIDVVEIDDDSTKPVYKYVENADEMIKSMWHLGKENGILLLADENNPAFSFLANADDIKNFNALADGAISKKVNKDGVEVWAITQEIEEEPYTFLTVLPATREVDKEIQTLETTTTKFATNEEAEISHFDLVLYPFKSYTQIKSGVSDINNAYNSSFTYTPSTFNKIKTMLDNNVHKTLAHNIVSPRLDDVVSINNYIRLNATIATNSKISTEEGAIIIDKIKIALANAFNMRELDFGEEIPFDSIVEVIEQADSRIRVASLNEPALYTTFSVFKDYDKKGAPIIAEYSIESDWLTVSEAAATSKFSYRDANEELISTFDTDDARKIYNKLAVRNILAGRLPLFNYNNTFGASFSEAPYQKTEIIDTNIPSSLPTPTSNDRIKVFVDGDITYTAQLLDNNETIKYTKTYTEDKYKDNVILTIDDNAITDIKTKCEIPAVDSIVSDLKLESGEFIKFRAPNFITTKTYPAYVNYNLDLNLEYKQPAKVAKADSLFNLLNADRETWNADNQDIRWQKVLNYFNNTNRKITKTIELRVSKFSEAAVTESNMCDGAGNEGQPHVMDEATKKCKYCGKDMLNNVQSGPIVIQIDDQDQEKSDIEELCELLAKSGCVKLTNDNFEARLEQLDDDGNVVDGGTVSLKEPIVLDMTNPFIISSDVILNITNKTEAKINELVGMENDGKPVLPTDYDWKICFDFECVPFIPESLDSWNSFILNKGEELFGFEPQSESEQKICLWRTFGEGYSHGKYILENTSKLLKFESSYFGLLPSSYLTGIYIVQDLGCDATPLFINNNEEYMLKSGEHLYIEYTPSSTSDDTATAAAAVTEVYGKGTIIRPSGFELGLSDSSAIEKSVVKTVDFVSDDKTTKNKIDLKSLGVNEQIEIRDFAQVKISKESFTTSGTNPAMFYYKNFNGCDELEKYSAYNGERINNVYTLKDGEYIFYTDQTKAELAYYSTGTQVTLDGRLVLEQCDIIDLSTIFDLGISEIPWKYASLASDEAITFKEHQYITIGPEDTLNEITLLGKDDLKTKLSSIWQPCNFVSYTLAGTDEETVLPNITLEDSEGNGWEVCSVLELDVSSANAQVLRENDKIKTSIILNSTSPSGGGISGDFEVKPTSLPLSFKTNLVCQAGNGKLNINDVASNVNKLKGFEFKVFLKDEPAVVKTLPNKVIPYYENITEAIDLNIWPDENFNAIRTNSNTWKSVDLNDIAVGNNEGTYDYALRLPINKTKDTYGVFSIYLKYTSEKDINLADLETWIEVAPGITNDDITLLNIPASEVVWKDSESNNSSKLFLNPGINCIKVDKSCRIFIKSKLSSDVSGMLMFDDLKLVNCTNLEYSDPSNTNKVLATKSTKGLNIGQLGYLAINGRSETDLLDSEMLTSLKNDYTNKAITDLDLLNKETDDDYKEKYNEVAKNKNQLKFLKDYVVQAEKEITAILENYKDDEETLLGLFTEFKNLLAEHTTKSDLLNIFEQGENIAETEKSLISKLIDFSSENPAKYEQLTSRLAELYETVKKVNESNLTEDAILTDFYSCIESISEDSDKSDLILKDLLTVSTKFVNDTYSKQLEAMSNSADDVANAEAQSALSAILNKLQSENTVTQLSSLLVKTKQLVEDSDKEQINDLLDTIYSSAASADYASTATYLATLAEILDSGNLSFLVKELENAANEQNYLNVTDLIAKLNKLLNNTADSEIITKINDIISDAEERLTTATGDELPAVDSDFLERIASLREQITDSYKITLKEILKEINTLTNEIISIQEEFTDISDTLNTTKNSHLKDILSKINSYTTERSNALRTIASIKTFGSDIINIPYYKDTVKEVWLDYMLQDISDVNNSIFKLIEESITAVYEGETIEETIIMPNVLYYINGENKNERLVLMRLCQITEFKNIYDELVYINSKNIQNSTYINSVNRIVGYLPNKANLESKLKDIINNSSDNAATIKKLLIKLQTASTQAAKYEIIQSLKSELNNSIELLDNLINLCASVLCPNILLVDKKEELNISNENETDNFYSMLIKKLKDERDALLDITDAANIVAKLNDIKTYVLNSVIYTELSELLENSTMSVNIITKLQNFELKKDDYVLLTEGFINSVEALLNTSLIYKEISDARNIRLFNVLTKHYAKQVLTKDNTLIWLTSTGAALVTDNDGNIYDANHNIYDENGNKIEIIRKLISDTSTDNTKFVYDDWRYANTDESIVVFDDKNGWVIDSTASIEFNNADVEDILSTLLTNVTNITSFRSVPVEFKNAFNTLKLEEQLLADIYKIDRNRDFYYTANTELSLAIDFNESKESLNTLLNPATNYDINNINNSFVISKLDIDYLSRGLQIARSSRLN